MIVTAITNIDSILVDNFDILKKQNSQESKKEKKQQNSNNFHEFLDTELKKFEQVKYAVY